MEDDTIPILELCGDRRGAVKALLRCLLDSTDLLLEIVSGVLGILKQVDNVADTTLLGRHAFCCCQNGAHAMLGVEKGKTTNVTAVLKICMKVL